MQDAEPTTSDGSQGRTVVETQIFHRPNPEADNQISDGGQEFPPFSNMVGTPAANPGRSAAPSGADFNARPSSFGAQQLHIQNLGTNPDNPLWPAPQVLGSASVMDLMHDPFFQFHDTANPYAGFWEIGNL